MGEDYELKNFVGLLEEENELDNLTKFNTTHNKRIPTLPTEEGNLTIEKPKRKRKNSRVTFSEDDEIINPEDVEPSLGCFRHRGRMAMTLVKKRRIEAPSSLSSKELGRPTYPINDGLFRGLPPSQSEASTQPYDFQETTFIGDLPMRYLNLAPDMDLTLVVPWVENMNSTSTPAGQEPEAGNEPKKKYAKEVWPGSRAKNPHLPY